jgi:hypothetical protein
MDQMLKISAVLAGTVIIAPHATASCLTFMSPASELIKVDCNQANVLSTLQASREFPDVFTPPGKVPTPPLCYASTNPALATLGRAQVTFTVLSGWTNDFRPFLLGGTDQLGTTVSQLTFFDARGNFIGYLYSRENIDFSQIKTTGKAPEESVIVGGTSILTGVRGTIQVVSAPEDQKATKVQLTELNGFVCSDFL